jgi:HSP90 family molecular chaperone
MQNIKTYKDKNFINVISDDLKLTNNSETNSETENKLNDEICSKIKELLSDHISKVIVSDKLESQPAIVTCNMGISANMERILNAQALGNTLFKSMSSNKVLEINPKHKLIKNLVSKSYDKKYLMIIYQTALLAGGFQLENMNDFLIKLYDFVEANDRLPSDPDSSNAQILETVSCVNESSDNKSCDNKSCVKESCTN